MHMFESLQLAMCGQQIEDLAPPRSSAGLFVDPAFVEGPAPFTDQEESVGHHTVS